MPLILPESSIKQYHEEGFTIAEGIICNDFIDSLKTILKDWSDKTISEWMGEGPQTDDMLILGVAI